jgi:hypothetical protein
LNKTVNIRFITRCLMSRWSIYIKEKRAFEELIFLYSISFGKNLKFWSVIPGKQLVNSCALICYHAIAYLQMFVKLGEYESCLYAVYISCWVPYEVGRHCPNSVIRDHMQAWMKEITRSTTSIYDYDCYYG